MRSDTVKLLFSPFATMNDGGKGLGLSMCWTILEAHGSLDAAPRQRDVHQCWLASAAPILANSNVSRLCTVGAMPLGSRRAWSTSASAGSRRSLLSSRPDVIIHLVP